MFPRLNPLASSRPPYVATLLLVSMVLLASVVGQDLDKRGRRRYRQLNCAIYVFAPRCRGVSAKRSSPSFYPPPPPVSRDIPDIFQILKNSRYMDDDAPSSSGGVYSPASYPKPAFSQSQEFAEEQPLTSRTRQQGPEGSLDVAHAQQSPNFHREPLLRRLLRLLAQRGQLSHPDSGSLDVDHWRDHLLSDAIASSSQIEMENLPDVLLEYKPEDDSSL